jgi:hypothetical protein
LTIASWVAWPSCSSRASAEALEAGEGVAGALDCDAGNAPLARDEHLGLRRAAPGEPEEVGRGSACQERLGSGREDGGQVGGEVAWGVVADAKDAAMDTYEHTRVDQRLDLALREARPMELEARDHSMLPLRDLGRCGVN